MPMIKLPGSGEPVFVPGTQADADRHLAALTRRHEFGVKYCALKGWPTDFRKLTIAQVLEIRQQPGWAETDPTDELKDIAIVDDDGHP